MRAYSGYTSNIGAGGLCLITRKSYAVGDALHLRIDVERETVELTGVVAWTRPGAAIGVRFDLISEEQRKAVLSLVHRVTGVGV
jgi:Tfp pilus assembly protein PilZ